MSAPAAALTIAVCTRDRAERLRASLAALLDQTDPDFELIVVDQSSAPNPELERLERERPRTTVLRDGGAGLSRARNLALEAATGDWIAFVDDDCLAEPDTVAALRAEIAAHPEVDWVSGDVSAAGRPAGDYPEVTTFPVGRGRHVRGRRVVPGAIGFGVFFAVRRAAARRLGGWDERLGPGVADFPAADDMDFNYRLLRSGGAAWLSPRVRLRHDQWRAPEALPTLHRGYVRAWAGFAAKQLRTGDVAGGLWLWSYGLLDVLDMAASAARRRSRLRARLAAAKLRGLAEGTALGLRRRW
jgi:glycosyltransferase involved in cell wall biosynthesis